MIEWNVQNNQKNKYQDLLVKKQERTILREQTEISKTTDETGGHWWFPTREKEADKSGQRFTTKKYL